MLELLDLAALLLPEADQATLILAHDDAGLGAADELAVRSGTGDLPKSGHACLGSDRAGSKRRR
jgi:hypothetical protein